MSESSSSQKVVLCPVRGIPLAVVLVPRNTRQIRVAGAYTKTGEAVNVKSYKVSSDKRMMLKALQSNAFAAPVYYHAPTDTFSFGFDDDDDDDE